MAGMRKASVFPDPVLAAPNTSFPANNKGMDFACTSVIVSKPISASALVVCSDKSKLENGCRSFGAFVGGIEEEEELATAILELLMEARK